MDAESKASDGITQQLLVDRWSKDSDDPDSQAILLRNIMSNLAQRGSDPVQVLSEVSVAPGKDDGDSKDSKDDDSEETESSEDDDEEEEEDDEDDDDSSNDDETEGESDDEDSATSSSGDSSDDDSSSDGERVQVKFVCRGVPGRPEGEVRAAALKASCQWRRLQRQLWRDYGEECKMSRGSSSKRHGVLHVSYLDAEGDECTVRSQRDLKVALRSHLACTTAANASTTTVFTGTAVPPLSANSAASWAVPSAAVPTSLRLFVNGPNHHHLQHRNACTNRSAAATMPRTTGLGLGAQRSPRLRSGDALKRAHSDGAFCLEVTSLSATVVSHEEDQDNSPIISTPRDDLALMGRQTVAATTPAPKTPRAAADDVISSSRSGPANNDSSNSHGKNRGGGDPPLYWKRGSLLGRGAYGQVYAALDLRNGAWLAVKQVRISGSGGSSSSSDHQSSAAASPAANKDPKVVALQREISLLENLQHPNIIKYLGTQRTKKRLNIFLEYASEGSIGAALQKFGPFSEFVVRKYASQLLDGLAYLHDQGVIHRDIKASNVLVSKGVVKLADFGCSTRTSLTMQAHRRGAGASGSSVGDEGKIDEAGPRSEVQHSVVGTTIYMAPEVLKAEAENANSDNVINGSRSHGHSRGGGSGGGASGGGSGSGDDDGGNDNGSSQGGGPGYGRKADVWSVGMLVLEMCSGAPPWRSASVAVYKACMTDELPPMPESLSSQGRDFVEQCLIRDPNQRPSAAALRRHPFCCWREREVGDVSPAALQAMLGSVRAMAGDDDDHERGHGQRASPPLSPAAVSREEESGLGVRFRGLSAAGLSALPLEAQDDATWSEGWGDLNNGGAAAAAAAAAKIELAASSVSQAGDAAANRRQVFLTQDEGSSSRSHVRNRAVCDTEEGDEKYDDDFEDYDESDEKEEDRFSGRAEAKGEEPLLMRNSSAVAEEKEHSGRERGVWAHDAK